MVAGVVVWVGGCLVGGGHCVAGGSHCVVGDGHCSVAGGGRSVAGGGYCVAGSRHGFHAHGSDCSHCFGHACDGEDCCAHEFVWWTTNDGC